MDVRGKQPAELQQFIGTVVKCNTDNLKYFVFGTMYEIENTQSRSWYGFKVKLKGISGFFSHKNFTEVPAAIIRDMRINDIFDDEATKEIVTVKRSKERKIDTVSNKEEALFRLIVKEVKGIKERDWKLVPFDEIAVRLSKRDSYFGLKPEDFESIRHMTIEQILNSNNK
jgi:hypothetical protein